MGRPASLLVLACVLLFATVIAQGQNSNEEIDNLARTCLTDNGAQVLVLGNGNNLILFTPGHRSAEIIKVTGVDAPLRAILFRASNGGIYGINNQKEIFQIDLETGAATLASDLSEADFKDRRLRAAFNPVEDSLRIISNDKFSYRVDVDVLNGTGLVEGERLTLSSSGNDNANNRDVLGIAYSEENGSANLHVLINRGSNERLVTISENDITRIPADLPGKGDLDGFDIFQGSDCQVAVISQGNRFYDLNLETGETTQIWKTSKWLRNVLEINFVDFAIVQST